MVSSTATLLAATPLPALVAVARCNSPLTSDDEDFSHFGSGLVAPRAEQVPSTTSVDFGGLLASPIQLHQDLAQGCGGQIWRAGELLTSYILREQSESLRGKRIVELGAGGGMTSLAVAKACDLTGSELWCTDMDAMIDLIHENVRLNSLEDTVRVQLLDWADEIPGVIAERPVDIILAADCVGFLWREHLA